MSRAVRRFIARHRRQKVVKSLVALARSIVKGDANFDYDPNHNGERFIAERVAASVTAPVFFDVGANTGGWTEMALSVAPKAQIHAFEIVPATYEKLAARYGKRAGVFVNGFGLGDRAGEVEVAVTADDTRATSVLQFHERPVAMIKCPVRSGDDYCAERGIAKIDLLKIDVEGGEPQVLRGFALALAKGHVRAIQFEYGRVSIHTRFLLKDFYAMLEPRGFVLGKIFPNYVEFAPYRDTAEDFVGPNYLAVLKSETALVKSLEG